MTTTQLIIAFFAGSFLNTIFWGSLSVLSRLYVYYRDKPLREQAIKDQEAFYRLLQARGPSQFDFDVEDKPETLN